MSFISSLKQQNSSDDEYEPKRQQNSTFERLKNKFEDKTFYDGVEYIKHFKIANSSRNDDNNRFFCSICVQEIRKESDVLKHCSNYAHIFRFMKVKYPNDFNRIRNIFGISDQIKVIENFLKTISSRLITEKNFDESTCSETVFRREMETIKLSSSPVHLDNLRDLEDKDDFRDKTRHETLLSNIKKSKSPLSGFLRPFTANSDDSGDDDNDNDEAMSSESDRGTFNTDFNDKKPFVKKNKRKHENSDVDTDSLEFVEDQTEHLRLITKKTLKVIQKNEISEKFRSILAENIDNLSLDEEVQHRLFEIISS